MVDVVKPFRSFSQLGLWVRCGELFYLKKIAENRPPVQPAAWLVHGNAFHEAADTWEATDRHGRIRHLYADAWETELSKQQELQPDWDLWVTTPRVKSPQQDLKLRYEAGLEQCDRYEEHALAAPWEPYATEVGFEIEFDKNIVRGYIDLIKYWPEDGSYSICDLKTGSPKEDYRQLSLYALAAQETMGLDVTYGEFWYTKLDAVPRSGDKAGRSSGMRQVGREGFGREYWNRQFTMLEVAIENKIFIANPDAQCDMWEPLAGCSLP